MLFFVPASIRILLNQPWKLATWLPAPVTRLVALFVTYLPCVQTRVVNGGMRLPRTMTTPFLLGTSHRSIELHDLCCALVVVLSIVSLCNFSPLELIVQCEIYKQRNKHNHFVYKNKEGTLWKDDSYPASL